MKFLVTRTSLWPDAKPCEEAIKEPYVRVDERTVNAPDKIPAYIGKSTDWWYEGGRNHRVEHGHIMRDFDDEAWFVEINSLEELLKFRAKYGSVVIESLYNNHALLHLEIYDYYRE